MTANVKSSYTTKVIHASKDGRYPSCQRPQARNGQGTPPFMQTDQPVTCAKCGSSKS